MRHLGTAALAYGALLGLGSSVGCTRDPMTAPSAVATAALRRDVSFPRPTSPVVFQTDSGAFVLDPVAATITAPAGEVLVLDPDALDYFVEVWQNIQATDQAGAEVEQESAARRSRQPAPPPAHPPCKVDLNGRCRAGDGGPLAIPRTPDAGVQDVGGGNLQAIDFWAIDDWSCRDIAIAMRDEMVVYRASKRQYATALGTLFSAAVKNIANINLTPKPGESPIPVPSKAGEFFWRYSLYSSAGAYEAAEANWQMARTRIGFLGTLYNVGDCLHRDWDPPVEQSPASSGGGGSNGGLPGSGTTVCYYEVTRSGEGVVLRRTFLYCQAL